MYFFYFFAAALLIRRLSSSITDPMIKMKWRSLSSAAVWIIWGLFIGLMCFFYQMDGDDSIVADLVGSGILLGLVWYIDKEEDFKSYKFYLVAHYPLIAIGFLSALVQIISVRFYDKYSNYFTLASLAAFVWLYARWANSKKQREELMIVNLRNSELDTLVTERTAELTRQKDELQETVKLLQATQQQLIQQEKLASLGELTAGIAHEIQNPLNFVNNFSEVSVELIAEMEEEIANGNNEEVIAIAGDIKMNLEKIMQHGKRADGIVKGMLQHSRASTGTKELTDVNALADEYLRLAYHGLRAKDKSFNAEMVIKIDTELPMINVIPQDIGRVLLNLFNNAFYATHQKQKTARADYKPIVELSTQKVKGFVEIKIKDNGTGISDAIKDKIMQPFFTTKPTGEGTGLGLSLSHDILVKGHGGSMTVDSVENEYSIFIVKLPV